MNGSCGGINYNVKLPVEPIVIDFTGMFLNRNPRLHLIAAGDPKKYLAINI